MRVPLGRGKRIRPSDRGDPDEEGPDSGCQAGWLQSESGRGGKEEGRTESKTA